MQISGSILIGLLVALAACKAEAYDIPAGLQTFYDNVKGGGCQHFLDDHNTLNDGQGTKPAQWGFCLDTANALYLTGQNTLGDMVCYYGYWKAIGGVDQGFANILSLAGY